MKNPSSNPKGEISPGDKMRLSLESRLLDSEAQEVNGTPPPIPDHVLLRRIGRGAYGEVWLARSALGSLRAVKLIYRNRFKEDRPYEREFHGILKYEPVSRTHEGLVQVLHVGRHDELGCFYYVMELADNTEVESQRSEVRDQRSGSPDLQSLTSDLSLYSPRTLHSDLARRKRFPPEEAAQLAVRLTGALVHLHAHGLVHRDIKPSNMIFVRGKPKLADIGLVTDLGGSRSFVGTDGFIPPEGPGTPQADLYSLGKLLYELATGRDRMDFPQLPPPGEQRADSESLLELNEVMVRACAPEPRERYATVTEMQADLNLFLAGHSLRRARHVERHLARLKKFSVVACAFLVLAAVTLWVTKNEERRAREQARVADEHARTEALLRQRAEVAEFDSQQRLYTALLEQARATVLSGEMGQRVRALDALGRAASIANRPELRREMMAALALPDLRFEHKVSVNGSGEFWLQQMDPAFERIALARGIGPVEIRSVVDQRLLASLPASTNFPANNAQWSPDGRYLAVKRDHDSAGHQAQWEIWDPVASRLVLSVHDASWNAADFHPAAQEFSTGMRDGTVARWDLTARRETSRFSMGTAPVCLSVAPDGERFAVVRPQDDSWIVSVHDAANGAVLLSHPSLDLVSSLEWHPEGRWVACSDYAGGVWLLESRTGEVRTLGRHKAEAVKVAFSPDGRYLVSAGWDQEFICWNVVESRREFNMALDSIRWQFRRDGRACAVATSDGVRVYAFEHPTGHRQFEEDLGGRVRHAAWSSDGRWFAASGDRRLGVWDLSAPGPGALSDQGSRTQLTFSRAGELFASRRGHASRWRVAPGHHASAAPELTRLDLREPAGFVSLSLATEGVVLTGARGSLLAEFDELATGEGRWGSTLDGLNGLSPDGHWLGVFRSFTPDLHIYRLPEMEQVAILTNQASIGDFQFSPRGDEVAVASRAGVEFWSTTNWRRIRSISNSVAAFYAPDARTLWLTKNFRSAGLHDAQTIEPLLPLPTGMLPLALSPDGRQLAVSVDARRLQIWDLMEVRSRLRELGMDWDLERPGSGL